MIRWDAVLRIAESVQFQDLREGSKRLVLLCYTRFLVNSRFSSETQAMDANLRVTIGLVR